MSTVNQRVLYYVLQPELSIAFSMAAFAKVRGGGGGRFPSRVGTVEDGGDDATNYRVATLGGEGERSGRG